VQKFFGAKTEAEPLQGIEWIGPDGQRANGPVEA